MDVNCNHDVMEEYDNVKELWRCKECGKQGKLKDFEETNTNKSLPLKLKWLFDKIFNINWKGGKQ